jgi:hypothetical protein
MKANMKKAVALCPVALLSLVPAALSFCGVKQDEATALRIRAEQVDGRATRTNDEKQIFELAGGAMQSPSTRATGSTATWPTCLRTG